MIQLSLLFICKNLVKKGFCPSYTNKILFDEMVTIYRVVLEENIKKLH